ncbi:MAG: hypothetical protein JO257_26365 [Deltaproteobacteria bacterium]|nr:hypothetical protein [Deltaproteobacteria bacterium]
MKSDLMATIVPGTVLLAFAAFGGCVIPAASSGGGGYPSNGGGGGYSSAPASSSESAPPPGSSSSASSAPAGPQVVSVTLHNDCPNTVKLFLGEKPKFGSGTNTSLGSNTTTSYQMKPGDMIWITDDSENGLSSTSIGGGGTFQSIRIMPSCTGFGPG